ncbi:transcription antitermination factor NusB [Fulvivirgaceae bacterium BMA12]|uniref:Transcription antitermination factor NusB n=1 Tax=Agaribacillus aureus TaxID=3051825 RepID=A0ABT8LE38_9BACT|nr:transcription antitermination factor NusB [Fulvivirgaceae bacterium BMA12]
MLNRRSLRIKVAQNLYAYNQCKRANYEIALKEIEQRFQPDLLSPEEQDKEELKQSGKQAVAVFKRKFVEVDEKKAEPIEEKIKEVVNDVYLSYENNLKKDLKFLRRNLVIDAEKIVDRQLMVFELLVEFAEIASGKYFKNPAKFVSDNLKNNQVIAAIKSNKSLQNMVVKKNIHWNNHHQDVLTWYREIINETPEYIAYKGLKAPDLDDDRKIVTFIAKNQIFKNEIVNALFEELDLTWEENKVAVKSMVLKTIKSIEADKEEWTMEVSPLSYNWEDDKAFFEKLFIDSVENDEDFENLVAEKSKNWDIHRLAMMDKIILKMAICEMIKFPSIPIKVTINEYIEISKRYSTPKSKQFVNGLLDSLANKLVSEGIVKKSGRGLIDNK